MEELKVFYIVFYLYMYVVGDILYNVELLEYEVVFI